MQEKYDSLVARGQNSTLKGQQGEEGPLGIIRKFVWNEGNFSGDPGAGRARANADFKSGTLTEVYISTSDEDGSDVTGWLNYITHFCPPEGIFGINISPPIILDTEFATNLTLSSKLIKNLVISLSVIGKNLAFF